MELGRLFMNRPEAAHRLIRALRIARLGLDGYETAVLDDVAATLYPYTRHYKANREGLRYYSFSMAGGRSNRIYKCASETAAFGRFVPYADNTCYQH